MKEILWFHNKTTQQNKIKKYTKKCVDGKKANIKFFFCDEKIQQNFPISFLFFSNSILCNFFVLIFFVRFGLIMRIINFLFYLFDWN